MEIWICNIRPYIKQDLHRLRERERNRWTTFQIIFSVKLFPFDTVTCTVTIMYRVRVTRQHFQQKWISQLCQVINAFYPKMLAVLRLESKKSDKCLVHFSYSSGSCSRKPIIFTQKKNLGYKSLCWNKTKKNGGKKDHFLVRQRLHANSL